jgi:curli biogenesis system outer membrane secretion channel CsgG
MSISNRTNQVPNPNLKPTKRKKPQVPLAGHPAATPNLSAFGTKTRRAAAPRPSVTRLIGPPTLNCQASQIINLQLSDKPLATVDNWVAYQPRQRARGQDAGVGAGQALIMVNELEMSRCHHVFRPIIGHRPATPGDEM